MTCDGWLRLFCDCGSTCKTVFENGICGLLAIRLRINRFGKWEFGLIKNDIFSNVNTTYFGQTLVTLVTKTIPYETTRRRLELNLFLL